MSDYIKPPYQLPEQAESLHAVDWQAFGRELGKAIAIGVKVLVDEMEAMAAEFSAWTYAMQRDNAYHPTGPIVHASAYVVPDDQKALPESREA